MQQVDKQLEQCCHHSQPSTKLMVCSSADCQEEDKVGCQSCFLLKHIHGDVVEFKRMEELTHQLEPLKAIATDKKRLEDKIEKIYAAKLQEFEDTLKAEKGKLSAELNAAIPAQISSRLKSIADNSLNDTQLYREVLQNGSVLSKEVSDKIKQACEKLEEEIKRWDQPLRQPLTTIEVSNRTNGTNGTNSYANSESKRERPHQLEQSEGSRKQFKKQNLAQTSTNGNVPQGNLSSIQKLFESYETPNKLSEAPFDEVPAKPKPAIPFADKSVLLTSYESGVRYLEDVQYDVAVDIAVNDSKNSSMTKFIHTLCRLEKVENLHLKLGKATDLTQGLLKKIDDTVSCLPRLISFKFEGWSSEPNCKAANFTETRRRLRNDKSLQIVLQRLEYLIE